MYKLLTVCFLVLLLITSFGCDLFEEASGTVYFYAIAGEDNEPSTHILRQREGGHVIIMSRGEGNEYLDKAEAEALVSTTVFMLQLDGESLAVIDAKTVDELGDSGWHVVQSYRLPNLAKGTHALLGTTTFQDKEGNPQRSNLVTLTIN